MSKAVLFSVHPKWCEKIVNGNKTIEVSKRAPQSWGYVEEVRDEHC